MDSGIGSSILSISSSDEEVENNMLNSFENKNDSDIDIVNDEVINQELSVNSEDEEDLAFVSFLNQTVQLHKELNDTSLSLHQISLLPEDNFSLISHTTTPLRKSNLKKSTNNYDSNMKSNSKNNNLTSPMTPIPLQDDSVYNVSLDLSGSPDLMPKISDRTPVVEKYGNVKSSTTKDKHSGHVINKKNSSSKKSNKIYHNNLYMRPSLFNYQQGYNKYKSYYTNHHESKIPLFPAYDTNSDSDNQSQDSDVMGIAHNHNFTGNIPLCKNHSSPSGHMFPSQYWRERLRKREMTSILGSPKSKFLFQ